MVDSATCIGPGGSRTGFQPPYSRDSRDSAKPVGILEEVVLRGAESGLQRRADGHVAAHLSLRLMSNAFEDLGRDSLRLFRDSQSCA